MVNDTGVLVWGKAQETLQSSVSVWREHSLILNVIYNNNKKVKTITEKYNRRKGFSVNMRIKVTMNIRIGKSLQSSYRRGNQISEEIAF